MRAKLEISLDKVLRCRPSQLVSLMLMSGAPIQVAGGCALATVSVR